MSSSAVELTVEEGVALLTLARPQAGNAIDDSLVAELREHAESLSSRHDARVVVLSGRGENFCVGGDLAYFASLGDNVEVAMRGLAGDFHVAVAALVALDAPLIAVVRGAAAGGGLSLVCAADLVLAAESARFTMAYTGAGLSPDGGGSWFLPRVVGLRLATEMLLTNRRLSAAEAKAAGIVTEVIADSELEPAAEELAKRIAAGPTAAFGSVKRLLQASATSTLAEQLEAEAAEIARNASLPDGREGVAAFLEKRRPRFGAEHRGASARAGASASVASCAAFPFA
jgi:2-(1,2-epoxy-1,2-dihydrophenyl)acetyl-CoA isomerase